MVEVVDVDSVVDVVLATVVDVVAEDVDVVAEDVDVVDATLVGGVLVSVLWSVVEVVTSPGRVETVGSAGGSG